MFVSEVQPVAILKALFWVVCSLSKFVFIIMGGHMVLAYSMIGRVIAL